MTLPPHKREYSFKKIVNLEDEGLYGNQAIADRKNLSVKTFQFRISADSSSENLTGNPSFAGANLNRFDDSVDNLLSRINFRLIPKILVYNRVARQIKILDLDSRKTIKSIKLFTDSDYSHSGQHNLQIM